MVGKTLSHYKILEELGRGGMGIVYKGEDTKLHRTVAIKVLPAAALSSDDDRARFYREARAAASLSHPNIATVFEIDEAVPEGSNTDDIRPFIAMEFIEGDTLEDRIKQGPMKLEEAVRIASEIASGLEAAHKKDIVHRDIKAANVMMDSDGRAKILDFGLAQTALSTKLTRMGSTLGTVAYMSPEQARGEEVDARTDLWALGVTLYEMIAGRHPFAGDYEQAVVYSIMNEDPEPLTAVRTGVPMQLEWLVNKLLSKSAEERYQLATGLIVDLKAIDVTSSTVSRFSTTSMDGGQSATPIASTTKPSNTRLWIVVALGVIAAIGLFFAGRNSMNRSVEAPPLQHFTIPTPGYYPTHSPTMSEDGRWMAVGAITVDDRSDVLLIYDLTEVVLHVAEMRAGLPAFSPNGEWLTYTSRSALMKMRVPDGTPSPLFGGGFPHGVWENDRSILITEDNNVVLYRVDAEDGSATELARSDSSLYRHFWDPYPVPGFDIAIVSRARPGTGPAELLVIDLKTGAVEPIGESMLDGDYVNSGHIIYVAGGDYGVLTARPFDARARTFTGPAVDILRFVSWSDFSVGRNGALVTVGSDRSQPLTAYRLGDPDATDPPFGITPGHYRSPALSPDGHRIALVHARVGESGDIFVYDRQGGPPRQLTSSGMAYNPSWTADGLYVAYTKRVPGSGSQIFRVSSSGSGIPEQIPTAYDTISAPVFSPDGKWMIARVKVSTVDDYELYKFAEDDSVGTKIDLEKGMSWNFMFSKDGRYLTYLQSPVNPTVRIIQFDGDGFLQAPSLVQAGTPRFTDDGNYLYTIQRGALVRVPVTLGDNLAVGNVEVVSTDPVVSFILDPHENDVILIGRRGAELYSESVEVWLNFPDHLRKIAPPS